MGEGDPLIELFNLFQAKKVNKKTKKIKFQQILTGGGTYFSH